MALVNYLAELWGISIVVLSVAMLIRPKYINMLFASMDNEIIVAFWGIISFVIGLAMVLSYSVWEQSWQVIITILGWASLIKGIFLLFVPKQMIKWTNKVRNNTLIPYALIVSTIIGLVITYFGFTA